MIPFYVVSVLWLLTVCAWVVSEKQNKVERMEILKLYRAHSLTDYTAQAKPTPRSSNFIQQQIGKAYSDLLGDDDD